MNRRRFVTVSFAGLVGLSLNSVFSANTEARASNETKIKFIPEWATIMVNYSSNVPIPLSKLSNGWPPSWQYLGQTTTTTKLEFSSKADEPIITDLFIEKLDVKLTGIPVVTEKVKSLLLVINNKLDDKEMHLLSRNVKLVKTGLVKEEKDFIEYGSHYIATFNPVIGDAKSPFYFHSTFFS